MSISFRKMQKFEIKEMEDQNRARRLACLPPLKIKIVECLRCGELFESCGNRLCGCEEKKGLWD